MAASWFTRLAVQGVTAKVMAAQDFLLDSQVQAWLDGLEPAWTLLTFESLQALRHEPAATRTAIRIANDLSCDEIAGSPIARNTLILLRAAIAHGGLPLTATGNLTRAVVAKMCTLMAWPDYDQADAFRFNKVINEPDFLPLHVVRQLVQAASLVRAQRGKLVATPLGESLLSEARQGSLLAILFHLAFWHMDLGYFGRGLLGSWPQKDAGVVLWSLSACANEWQSAEKLTRLCTIPEPAMLSGAWDKSRYAMEARILRPLLWFDLTRAVVAKMCTLLPWPDYDQADAFRFNKVINEPDFLPLHVVRQLVQAASLVRAQRGKLVATPLGESLLSEARQGSLLAILFHLAFWHMDLSYFGRGLLGSWPQKDAGVVLWSLSACANEWQSAEKLTRLCTIPEPAMLSGAWDKSRFAMEARILRPLLWFGLLEQRSEKIPNSQFGDRHFYRKAQLFDRLLTFAVQVELSEGVRH